VHDIRVALEERHEVGSKVGVFVSQLEREGREYQAEITVVLEATRAKE
jgi:hypothetical protein